MEEMAIDHNELYIDTSLDDYIKNPLTFEARDAYLKNHKLVKSLKRRESAAMLLLAVVSTLFSVGLMALLTDSETPFAVKFLIVLFSGLFALKIGLTLFARFNVNLVKRPSRKLYIHIKGHVTPYLESASFIFGDNVLRHNSVNLLLSEHIVFRGDFTSQKSQELLSNIAKQSRHPFGFEVEMLKRLEEGEAKGVAHRITNIQKIEQRESRLTVLIFCSSFVLAIASGLSVVWVDFVSGPLASFAVAFVATLASFSVWISFFDWLIRFLSRIFFKDYRIDDQGDVVKLYGSMPLKQKSKAIKKLMKGRAGYALVEDAYTKYDCTMAAVKPKG